MIDVIFHVFVCFCFVSVFICSKHLYTCILTLIHRTERFGLWRTSNSSALYRLSSISTGLSPFGNTGRPGRPDAQFPWRSTSMVDRSVCLLSDETQWNDANIPALEAAKHYNASTYSRVCTSGEIQSKWLKLCTGFVCYIHSYLANMLLYTVMILTSSGSVRTTLAFHLCIPGSILGVSMWDGHGHQIRTGWFSPLLWYISGFFSSYSDHTYITEDKAKEHTHSALISASCTWCYYTGRTCLGIKTA